MTKIGLIERLLGEDYKQLPPALQDLHTVPTRRRWRGKASVQRGNGVLARIAGWIGGFPPATADTTVEIEMLSMPSDESWIRTFGATSFRSSLAIGVYRGRTVLVEQFGVFRFAIDLHREADRLQFPVLAVHILGLPLPKIMRPISETCEFVDAEGRPCFDVRISLPIGGLVAHYAGWLDPIADVDGSHFS